MADINHVVLIGRLTRDAELRYTANGTAVCKFAIAVNRRRKNGDQWEDEASFFDIVLWDKQGESLNQYLLKGKQICVSGELRQERWQQDGQNRSRIEIVASGVQLLGGGNNAERNGNGDNDNSQRNTKPAQTSRSGTYQRENDDGFADDIPF